MLEVAKIVEQVMHTSGNIAKANVLDINKNNDMLKAILKFIYDPYTKCGIGQARLNKVIGADIRPTTTDPLLVIDYLKKNNTGTDAAVLYAGGFVRAVHEAYGNQHGATDLAVSLVTQDLKIGLAVKSLNSIFGSDFIHTIGCMLGTLYADVPNVEWPCIVTEKLDGVRRLLVKQDGIVRMFSRSGHEDTGCVEIIEEAKHLPDGFVYDGELLAIGTFKDSISWRQATNSIGNSKGVKKNITLNVFDMVPAEEFFAGRSKQDAISRKIVLGATLGDEGIQYLIEDWARYIAAYQVNFNFKFIKPVPILGLAPSMGYVTPIVDKIWERHGEGVMLNTCSARYEVKRSKHLLKIKHTEDIVLPIIDFLEGSGKYEDSLGALVVEYKGMSVGVGSGLTDLERRVIWESQDAYLGALVEIETFGESVNAAGTVSLNCPIFKRFVGED